MQPARYGECYLNLYHYTRFGTEVRIGIRNYLQNAKGQQSINALALQGRLFNAINRKLGKSGSSVPARAASASRRAARTSSSWPP